MADALGLAASAAGIVSLGLQVYTGISSYVDGINDRKTELSAVTRQADTLQTAVNALQDALPQINAVLSNNRSPLVPALKRVEEELWALRLFLDTLQEQQVPNQTPGFATTMKQQKKKFTFPFHRPTLEKLQKKLESANNALQTSLQVVDLMITTSMSTTMSGVHTTVGNSQAILMDTRSSIRSLENSMSSMALSLAPTQASIGSIEGKLDSLMTSESLEMKFRSLDANMGHVSEEMHEALRTVPVSTATILTAVIDQKLVEMMSHLSTESSAPTNINQGQLVMGRLLSKPRDLKDACDLTSASVAHTPQSVRLFQQTHRSCDCHTRTVKYHEAKKFGDFFAIKKGTTQRQHLPGCEFEADDYGSTAHVRAIGYTGLRWILSRSVELSMSWTSGAGGSSISPSITLRPMVDETRSPPFCIVNIVSDCAESYIWSLYAKENNILSFFDKILDHSVRAILRTYRGSRCSFYDVNQYGESVLFKWINLLSRVYEWMIFGSGSRKVPQLRIAAGLSVRQLIPKGSRGSLSNYNGVSPLVDFIDCVGLYYFPNCARDFEVLYSYDHELLEQTHHDIRKSPIDCTPGSWDLIPIFEESQIMTEILAFGPLSRSIVSQDTKAMRSLLKKDPRLLFEINYALQTPFHLAAETCNPDVFKVLIKVARGFATQLDTPDALGRHALDVLVLSSGDACRNVQHATCRHQICFDMLQSTGWQLSAVGIFLPCEPLSKACDMIKLSFLSTTKQAREEFRKMARPYLSAYERQRFQIDGPEVLDGQAYNVVERLVKMGANLPEGYKILLQEKRFVAGNSVYHNLCNDEIYTSHLAELLYCNGFTDIDHENVDGETPLYLLCRQDSYECSKLTLWFLQHGADALRTLPVESTNERPVRNLRIAHQILDFSYRSIIFEFELPIIAEVIRHIAPLQIYDECFCGCVEAGCTTTTSLFRWLWEEFFVRKRRSLFDWFHDRDSVAVGSLLELTSISEHGDDSWATEELDDIDTKNEFSTEDLDTEEIPQTNCDNEGYHSWLKKCTHRLSEFLRALQLDFAQWSHVSSSTLRFLTFQALGIRHTCHCGLWKGRGSPCRHHSEEVIEEMQEEDRELLNSLKALVEEFVEKLECSGDTFERFLTGYWVGRMEVVLRHLEAAKMSPEQVRAAEDVGVIWEDSSAGSVRQNLRSSWSKRAPPPPLSEVVETLISEIDMIVAEST